MLTYTLAKEDEDGYELIERENSVWIWLKPFPDTLPSKNITLITKESTEVVSALLLLQGWIRADYKEWTYFKKG